MFVKDKLGMTMLVLTLLSPAIYASEAFLEIPIVFSTNYSPALSTEIRPGAGIGWTHFPLKYRSLRFGYGALFTISPLFRQGTRAVYASGLEMDLEARTYLAYAFEGTNISFWPYSYLGPNGNVRLSKLHAYETSGRVTRLDYGFRGGLGMNIRLGDFAVKIDGGVGYAASGLNLRTWIVFGFGIF